MRLCAVRTPLVKPGDELVDLILESLRTQDLRLENDDVLALTSKIVAYSEGRLARLSEVKPSMEAKKLGKRYSLKPEFAELIIRESERIYGGVEKAVLTFKNGVMTPNAGIDNKNTPDDYAVLWPSDPERAAEKLMDRIKQKSGKNVAVLIVDSGLVPLRIGTVGLALGVAGFQPIGEHRGKKDLYGKTVVITRHALADDLASAAHLLMGESAEKNPVVLVRDVPLDFDDSVHGPAEMMMPPKECIFMNTLS